MLDTDLTYLPCGLWGNETVRLVLFYRGTDKDAEGNVLSDLQSQGEIPQRQPSGRCLIASKAKLHPPIASGYFSPSARRSHLRLGSTFDLGSLTTEPVIRSVHKSIPIEVCGVRLARTLRFAASARSLVVIHWFSSRFCGALAESIFHFPQVFAIFTVWVRTIWRP